MNRRQRQYRVLDEMGITLWTERQDVLVCQTPLLAAPCLVLLQEPVAKGTALYKMLQGMLGVLAGSSKRVCGVAWAVSGQRQAVIQRLRYYVPQSILVLGERLAQDLLQVSTPLLELRKSFYTLESLDAEVRVTYHPCELTEVPAHKPKAYQDLLQLKEYLGAL